MDYSVSSPPINKRPQDPSGSPGTKSGSSLFSLPEVRITAYYVLLASFWIIGSDTLLDMLVGDNGDTFLFQTFKGLYFVITTGIILFCVLRRSFGGWRRAEEGRLAAIRSGREGYRRLSSRIQGLREEERTLISREIHDELGQLLTGVKMRLRLIEDHLNNRNDRSLNPLIDDLVEGGAMIDETIDSVRRISSGLRPLALDHLGLAAAVEGEAEQFSRRTGIECRVSVEGMERIIPPEIETAAFRIFQESLTNVARHADARRIDVRCSIHEGVLTLAIQDDGRGMDASLAANPMSLGLVGMLERAADAGGRLEFQTAPGNGTGVVLTVPLEDAMTSPTPLHP